MAIIDKIYKHAFANWIQNSGSYNNNFSWEGANALQEYIETLSEDLDEDIVFDPIAWCCEWTEYKDYEQAWVDRFGVWEKCSDKYQYFNDNTLVIEFEKGILIKNF
jgi:hypothetical protein